MSGLIVIGLYPRLVPWVWNRLFPTTVEDRVEQVGEAAAARWRPYVEKAGVDWPPKRVALLGFKFEQLLEVYADGHYLRAYPVLAASGAPGPKLKEGDQQVPEGIYAIDFLNPNSRYHLSMRVNSPNAFDRKMAEAEGRTGLGGDIMIHG
ncbi:MAG: hypothetical protein AAF492_20740, partial [Verrucomicrobiota bacterium]